MTQANLTTANILTCPLTFSTVDVVMMILSLVPMNFVESVCTEKTRKSRHGFVVDHSAASPVFVHETPVEKVCPFEVHF